MKEKYCKFFTCSNHMCGHKLWFSNLDETFRHSVKLGNNSKMGVMGKGNIQFQVDGVYPKSNQCVLCARAQKQFIAHWTITREGFNHPYSTWRMQAISSK